MKFRIILTALVLVAIGGIYALLAPASGDQPTPDNSTPTSQSTQTQGSDSGSYSGIGK